MDLYIILDTLPLHFANLRRPLSERVYAGDAYLSGGGVVYARVECRSDALG